MIVTRLGSRSSVAQDLVEGLQHRHAVLAQHIGLGQLALRNLFQIYAFGAAKGGALAFPLVGNLHGDLGFDKPRLLIGGGAGLFGFDALFLRLGLALIGLAQLVGQLLAMRADQDFRRNGRFAKPDFLDLDAGFARLPA